MDGRSARVTIGVPVNNGERYLDHTLATLSAQSFNDLEILVGDNASTDTSLAIALDWAARDDRIRVLRSAENRGAAWNFNRLVEAAAGELFMWAAADDEFAPEYVEELVGALDAADDAVLAHASTIDIDENGEAFHTWELAPSATSPEPAERFLDIMANVDKCFAVFGVIRTDVLRRSGLIGSFSGSDKILLAELALHGRFVHVDRPLFRHREHDGRSMNRYPDERTRPAWFDPALAGKSHLPYWRTLRGYVDAIARCDLPIGTRSRASVALGWYVRRWHRALASDLVRTCRALPQRVARRTRSIDRPERSRR